MDICDEEHRARPHTLVVNVPFLFVLWEGYMFLDIITFLVVTRMKRTFTSRDGSLEDPCMSLLHLSCLL